MSPKTSTGGLRALVETWWREPLPDAGPALLGRQVPDLIAAGLLDVAERDLEWFKRRTAKTREWSPGVQMRQFGPAGSQTFFAAMQLADTLAANGNLAEAIARLEEAVSDRVAVVASNTPTAG
jgi:hypothetical protein